MRAGMVFRGIGFSLVTFACAFIFSTCGGKQSSVAPLGRGLRAPPPTHLWGAPSFQAATPCETTLTEALAELDALPTPEGVDESLFSDLKAALREALQNTWTTGVPPVGTGETPMLQTEEKKIVATPPFGEGNIISDLSLTGGGTSYHLAWGYKNIGDYNQDGIVNVMDITPLAVHFHEEADPTNWWIDGNCDTVINIMDITPLAAHFFSDVAGYKVLGSDFSEGEFTEVGDVPFAPPEGEEALRFTAPVPTSGHKYFAVAPYDSEGILGDMSNIVHFDFPPVARITADPPAGDAPLSVTFFAGDSYDPDGGTIVRYRWDLDGDGAYEYDSGGVPTASTDYIDPGSYQARVLVTDDDGDTDTASLTLSVGISEWVHTWGTTIQEEVHAIAVDDDRAVYAVGFTRPIDDNVHLPDKALILKYDAAGDLAWVRSWRENSRAEGAAIDADGTLCVSGIYPGGLLAMRWDPNGNVLWARTWGGDYCEYGHAVAIDDSGHLYVAGTTTSFGAGDSVGGHHKSDAVIVKFDSEGSFLWARTWGGYDENERPYAVVVDAEQNVYVAGSTSLSDIEQYSDLMLLKYDPDGNLLWSKVWGGEGESDGASAITVDDEGNLYICGSTSFGRTEADLLLLKLDSDGSVIWQRAWGGEWSDHGADVRLDAHGGVYVAGHSYGLGLGEWDVLLLKYDLLGNLLWGKLWGTGEWDEGLALAIDEGGTLYIGGYAWNAYGDWKDVWAESIPPDLQMRDVVGVITEPEGTVGVPGGATTIPEGVQDEGAGGANQWGDLYEDALVIKHRPE